MRRIGYFISETITNLRRNLLMTIELDLAPDDDDEDDDDLDDEEDDLDDDDDDDETEDDEEGDGDWEE